jgi:hypothetical protein
MSSVSYGESPPRRNESGGPNVLSKRTPHAPGLRRSRKEARGSSIALNAKRTPTCGRTSRTVAPPLMRSTKASSAHPCRRASTRSPAPVSAIRNNQPPWTAPGLVHRLTMGTRQLVVQEALETIWWSSGSKLPSFTPITKGALPQQSTALLR